MTIAPDHRAVISRADLDRRIIEPSQFVADTAAFVDVRLPLSQGKASYSFIGPGVSQNADQPINLVEPHGFNIGAASMPHGRVNSQHLHFTAEVFICTRGRWKMNVGENCDQQVEIGAGDVFSVPTWVFRGFENLGDDDGWLFTVLGGDDTGGILWAPSVLRDAADTGLYLAADHSILDATAGDSVDDVVRPLTPEHLTWVRQVSDADLIAQIVQRDALRWSAKSLISHVVAGHDVALAPVIGHGMTEDRDHVAPISTPHGFSIEWMRIDPGGSTGSHRHGESQVLFVVDGDWQVSVNGGADRLDSRPAAGSVVSIPPCAWRDFANVGTSAAHALVVNGGDAPNRLEWDDAVIASARAAGWSHDASGFIAPVDLLGRGAS